MAIQVAIPYRLIGPDGTEAVLNDSAHPNFVGLLNPDGGVSGLDSPETRENASERVERDGGRHGPFYHGRRPVVLQGIVWPSQGEDQADANARADRLIRASNAMREDAELVWQEDGRAETRLLLRRQQPTRITGRRPKAFQVSLVSASHTIESSEEHTASVLAAGGGSSGFTFPFGFPLSFGVGGLAVGSISAYNDGDAEACPRFRIDGPITNPAVELLETGQVLELIYTLNAGEWLEVDMAEATVLLGGTINRYSAVDFESSEWWCLQPGPNTVRLLAPAFSAPAGLTMWWRDAWV